MKTTDIKKFFKKNKTPLLIAAGVIVLVVVVWIIVKRTRKPNPTSQKEKVEDLTGQQVTAGLNFDDLAKRMFTAWISTLGTDENEVYAILAQMNNQADWEYLKARYEAYWNGMPMYEQFIHTTAGLGLTGVLVSDFRRELSKSELQRCRDILAGHGIEPGF
jgi:hypothetical protein